MCKALELPFLFWMIDMRDGMGISLLGHDCSQVGPPAMMSTYPVPTVPALWPQPVLEAVPASSLYLSSLPVDHRHFGVGLS
jgi:hypothetical protein